MKKLVSMLLAASVLFSFATLACAANDSTVPTVSEKDLLDASAPVVEAYSKHYRVENVHVTDVTTAPNEDGGYVTQFFLHFDGTLKYDSALSIPRVKGIASSFGLSQSKSVDAFLTGMDAPAAKKALAPSVQKKMAAMNASGAAKNAFGTANTKAYNAVSDQVAEKVIASLKSFVSEIEEEYIGKSTEYTFDLQATLDAQGNVVKLSYGIVDGYSDDISVIIPESEAAMVKSGAQESSELADAMLKDLAAHKSNGPAITTLSNPGFKYYRVVARDYANRYTSDAASVRCTNRNCSNYGNTIRKNPNLYNRNYTNYCCNDCANYVSQAMKAGGVPTSTAWRPGSMAWINCASMRQYFYTNTNYWTLTTYSNCNAGGVILMHNSTRPYHAMMNVHNDGVSTKYSAHTNDRKALPYTRQGLLNSGAKKIEYFIFDNVSPAH